MANSSSVQPRNPYPTVDVILEVEGGIVLIERKNEPHGWALPGGFIDYGESTEDAARREVMEETQLSTDLTQLLGVYSQKDRDPRQHNMSVVYIGTADGQPAAGDDASAVKVFALDSLPHPLCFDHALIIDDYKNFLVSGKIPPPR